MDHPLNDTSRVKKPTGSADRSREFYRHLGANGLASRTKPEWDAAIVDALVAFLPAMGDILDVGSRSPSSSSPRISSPHCAR